KNHIEVSNSVSRDLLGIGYVSLPFIGNAKRIFISDNIKGFLERQLFLYIPEKNQHEYAESFVNFVKSTDGQNIVLQSDFLPICCYEQIRKNTLDKTEKIIGSIYFEHGSFNYEKNYLEKIYQSIDPSKEYSVVGYTDNTGNRGYNKTLS